MPPVETSVVIAVRNDAAGLRDTLDALARQTLARDTFEVIVVDDASSDGTAAMADGADGVTVLRRTAPGGAYAARNEGSQRRRGGSSPSPTPAAFLPRTGWSRHSASSPGRR